MNEFIISKKDLNLDDVGTLTTEYTERYNVFKIIGQNMGISKDSIDSIFKILLDDDTLLWINPTTLYLSIKYSNMMAEYKQHNIRNYLNEKINYSVYVLDILKQETDSKKYYQLTTKLEGLENDILRYALYYKNVFKIDF